MRYITTTLPYINANPHLGHALEFIQADFAVRALRARGEKVFLNIGTDEHGAKIAKKAEEEGKSPQEYADDYANRFKGFADRLDISYDSFLRTTDPKHVAAAEEFWKRCDKNGDIYKAEYEVKYCVGCELEKTDSELVDGRCPLHPNLEIEVRQEENYYFRFSKYQDALLELYANKEFVIPAERLKEIKSFVKGGLKDFSISRKKEKLAWGVPVPGDGDHVMYVWFDALVSYLSALGWPKDDENFEKWWPVTHFAGKDNLRQQSAMWQAMLLSASLPNSKQVFIHGFLTSGGQKMSKSLGNVIDPLAVADRYGTEALRYVLLRHANPFEDADLTEANIHEHYTANLANGLGNLVARVMKLASDNLPHAIELTEAEEGITPEFSEAIDEYRFTDAMDQVFAEIGKADNFMTRKAPYKGIKSGDTVEREEARTDIEELVRRVARIATHLAPAMPRTSAAILAAVRSNTKPENLFPRI